MTTASTSSETTTRPAETEPETYRPPTPADLVSQLPVKTPPPLGASCLRHGAASLPGEPVIIIHQTALLQANAHSLSNIDYELGGALLGQAYRHDGLVYVEVKAALPAVSADHGPVHFTFAADSWSQLQRDRAAHYPNLDIVGWFHTHPDLGVFYSSDDVVVHSAAFTLPWHIGLVVDPLREEAGFFGWVDSQLEPLSGFWELPDRQPETIVTWRTVRSAVWDSTYVPPAVAAPQESRVYLPGGAAGQAISTRQAGLLMGALALGLSLLLWLVGILPLQQKVNTLETTVLALADSALASTNALTCPDPRLRLVSPISGQSFQMGSDVPIVGTTALPDASRYQVELRPLGSQNWELLSRFSGNTRLDELASWDTSGHALGEYEIRLSAVDLNNIRLTNTSPCSIAVQLGA